jgi:hypothetical protein
MPTPTDPAPCAEGQNLYECPECGARMCSEERLQQCPKDGCDGLVQNLSKPRLE